MKFQMILLLLFQVSVPIHAQWIEKNGNRAALQTGTIYDILEKGGVIYIGTNDDGFGNSLYTSNNDGNTWSPYGFSTVDVTALASTSSNNFFAGTISGRVLLHIDPACCPAFEDVGTGLTGTSVSAFVERGSDLFVSKRGSAGGVFMTTNNGLEWTTLLSNSEVYDIVFNGSTLFATNGFVYRSTNNGASWTMVTSSHPLNVILSLAVVQDNVFAGSYWGGFHVSQDNGTNWSYVEGSMTSSVQAFASYGDILFAGNSDGDVFYCEKNGSTWTATGIGSTTSAILSLEVIGDNLFAGTEEKGMWSRALAEITPVPEPEDHPVSFSATSLSDTEVNLSFSAPSTIPNGFGYLILRRQGANPSISGVEDGVAPGSLSLPVGTTLVANITSSSLTSFSVANHAGGTSYNYLIIPYNYNENSVISQYNYKTNGAPQTTSVTTPFSTYSKITEDDSFVYPSDISYATYQEADDLTPSTSIEVAKLLLQDGDGASDSDNATTTLNTISFSITNASLIRRVALYDGTTELGEATPIDNSVSFSGLALVASDDGNKAFSVRISFNSTVSDNLQFSFVVSSAVAAASGSGFAATNAGAASTSTLENNNKIEVVASKLEFVQQPSSTLTNAIMSPAISVEAVDILNNRDLDFAGSVGLLSSNTLSITPTAALVNGFGTYSNVIHSTFSSDVTVTTTNASSLSNAVSNTFVVVAPEPSSQPTLLTFNTTTTSSMNGSFTAASDSPGGYIVLRSAGSSPTGVPQDGTTYTVGEDIGNGQVVHAASSTIFNDTGLLAGTVYHYDVFAFNGSGATINYRTASPLEASRSTLVTEPTAQPGSLTFSEFTTTSLKGSFTAASDSPAGYLVLRRAGASPTGEPIDGTSYTINNDLGNGKIVAFGVSTTFTDTHLLPNTVYHYDVFAYNGVSETINYSNLTPLEGSRTTLQVEPTTQAGALSFNTVSSNSMNGAFAAASSPVDGYLVLRKEGSVPSDLPEDGSVPTATLGTSTVVYNGSNTSFSSTDLTSGTVYHYKVFAYNGSGQAINYLLANSPVNSKVTVPGKPESLALSNPTANTFVTTWSSVTGASGYELDVSANDFVSFVEGYNAKQLTTTQELVEGLLPSTSYKSRIRAVNESGKSENSDVQVIATQAGGGGTLVVSPVNRGTQSGNTTLSITLSNGSGSKDVKFYSRGIREVEFDVLAITSTTSTYTATVTPAMQDELGLEFYFTASDASTSTPMLTNKEYIYKPIPSNTSIAGLSFGGALNNYRIISVPYRLDQANTPLVFSALGAYDNTNWRLIQYTGTAYRDNPSSIALGQGYWFNAREQTIITLGTGTVAQNNQNTPFEMVLQQGWNIIATPYPFAIIWSHVLEHNNDPLVGEYHVHTGTQYQTSNSLEPWSGGFVFADVATTLSIPVSDTNPDGSRKPVQGFTTNPDDGNWLVPFTMKHESIENNLLAFGMHEQALTSKDRFDAIALPELHHAAKLVSHHPEHFAPHFWRDVVPLQEEYVWPFTLTTVNNESVELQWDNKPFQNSRSQLLLYDAHAERLVDMRTTKSYTTSGNKVLEFIFTSDQKYSLQRELGKAFPNPFVQHVSLPAFINTQGSASITLTVKGLSGVEVYSRQWETKNEGLIQPEWKGVDGNGQSVSPGVYIYQITYSNDKHTVTSYGKLIKQ